MKRIKEIFWEHKRRYGSPRIFKQMKKEGFPICKTSVEKMMKELELVAKGKKRFRKITSRDEKQPVFENLLNRDFDVLEPQKVWLSDITFLPAPGGKFFYLCAILDLGSKEVVGWYVDDNMQAFLVYSAIVSALMHTNCFPSGMIFHSDQGTQFSANDVTGLLSLYGFTQSMSRRAQCWDNSPMESFFDTLKTEFPECLSFKTLDEAWSGLFEYIEIYYNRKRMHSSIDYQIPAMYKNLSRGWTEELV